jgi:hypothetical protein
MAGELVGTGAGPALEPIESEKIAPGLAEDRETKGVVFDQNQGL